MFEIIRKNYRNPVRVYHKYVLIVCAVVSIYVRKPTALLSVLSPRPPEKCAMAVRTFEKYRQFVIRTHRTIRSGNVEHELRKKFERRSKSIETAGLGYCFCSVRLKSRPTFFDEISSTGFGIEVDAYTLFKRFTFTYTTE